METQTSYPLFVCLLVVFVVTLPSAEQLCIVETSLRYDGIIVQVGDSVTMNCTSTPSHRIRWFFKYKREDSGTKLENKTGITIHGEQHFSRLQMNNISLDRWGCYICYCGDDGSEDYKFSFYVVDVEIHSLVVNDCKMAIIEMSYEPKNISLESFRCSRLEERNQTVHNFNSRERYNVKIFVTGLKGEDFGEHMCELVLKQGAKKSTLIKEINLTCKGPIANSSSVTSELPGSNKAQIGSSPNSSPRMRNRTLRSLLLSLFCSAFCILIVQGLSSK